MPEGPTITIGGRRIGPGCPAYVMAEVSANHHQSFDHAVALVRAAKQAGADAVKLQTYTPDTITIQCDSPLFTHPDGSLWASRTLYDLYREAYMPWEWQPKLKAVADGEGLTLFSSPFDASAVEFLARMGVPAYKIASFELIDHPLLEVVAARGRPVIMSTGMATRDEIAAAVGVLRGAGCRELALLKCTSAYPAPAAEMNLRTIADLAATFHVPAGLSDHSLEAAIPIAAVAAGACIIEKHFTLSRADKGPDSAFSLEPAEFAAMVRAIRTAEEALGSVSYEVTEREAGSRIFRRSLFVVKDIQAGETFTAENVRSIRPGHGLPPGRLRAVLGRRAARAIKAGTPLAEDLVL